MIDPRFYIGGVPLAVGVLFPDCEIVGDPARLIAGAASLAGAGTSDLTFADAVAGRAIDTRAGALVVRENNVSHAPPGAVAIVSAQPRAAFARAAGRLHQPRTFQRAPAISPQARLDADVAVGPYVTIGPDAHIGQGARIGPGAAIGPGVRIGRRSRIGAHAVIECALIGDDVTILPGAVIGQTGFGIAPGANGPVEMPHFGRVIIGDRVMIGANTTVDRGLFEDTIISEDAKIDNLCQIAHNVVIGRGVLMASFGGISGSVTIGDGAMLGGRVGVADHITIGKGASLGGGAAVISDVPEGVVWSGYPARSVRQWLRETAWLTRAARRRDAG